ncbi:MAG: class I SAM-dependent methyltransferase [Acidobacteriota bacterium]|nr:class I SAM-dependent methyltransferase [Acidobacteriota bacterium]
MPELLALPMRRFRPRRHKPGSLSTWSGHLPFASDLVAALRPALLVELGTHYGESYFGFCQAVEENSLDCRCFAVDTWKGDEHAGFYGEDVFQEVDEYNRRTYRSFSTLLRDTFDHASEQFAGESIDLLHIDGFHTYQAVKHDFETWFPKVKPGGLVLLHDVNVRHADFEVWQFWDEVSRRFPHFEFHHWWGLGVLRKPGGAEQPPLLDLLFHCKPEVCQRIQDQYAQAAELLDLTERNQGAGGESFIQIFPGMENGFEEESSFVSYVKPDVWHCHQLELPQGAPNGSIRIDVLNRPGLVEVDRIVVRNAVSGATLLEITHAGGLPCAGDLMPVKGGNARFFSFGRDPQLFVQAPEGTSFRTPLHVEIRMRAAFNLRPVSELLNSQETAAAARVESLRIEVRQAQVERVALEAEFRRLKAGQDMARLEGERLRGKWTREQDMRVRLEKQFEAGVALLREEIAAKDAAIVHLRNESAAERERQRELRDSYSWRITRPLRAMLAALGGR